MVIEELINKTPVKIDVDYQNNTITFILNNGEKWRFEHYQDCCETVDIDDINGDIEDLLYNPLIVAEMITNRDEMLYRDSLDCFTWTFYRFATIKGYVIIRWLGESNGYYSESVDLIKLKE